MQMKSQQICNLLLETERKQGRSHLNKDFDSIQSDYRVNTNDDLKQKLEQILDSLELQKNQFIVSHHLQQQSMIEKIHMEKDQIIEELLKSIHNLKKQNEQLKFQYRKRFKVMRNISDKYQNLILAKNKKINEFQSVLKYLQTKIKFLQKKLQKHVTKTQNGRFHQIQNNLQRSLQTYLSPNKVKLSSDKQIEKIYSNQKSNFRNSFDQLTIPLTSSFVSLSKASSSSKTITRKRCNPHYNQNIIFQKMEDFKQSDLYSSFLASTEHNFNQNNADIQINSEDQSRISPVCFQKYPKMPKKYLTLQDFDNLQNKELKISDRSMRTSQQVSSTQANKKINIFKEKL